MARSRNIKPGFFANEELVELPFSTRLLFIGLWTIADREGRLEDKPKRIKMILFPADSFDIDEALGQLEASGFIQRYGHGADRFIAILAFGKHQNPHRDEKASNIPAPCEHSANTVQEQCEKGCNTADSFNLIPDSLSPDVSGKPDAREKDVPPKTNPSVGFDDFWNEWPATQRKVAKSECLKKWKLRNLGEQSDSIVTHIRSMKGTKAWQEGYEPAPLTYLNQRRWEDGPTGSDSGTDAYGVPI